MASSILQPPSIPDTSRSIYSQTHLPLLMPTQDSPREVFTVKYTLFSKDAHFAWENSQEGFLPSSGVLGRTFLGEVGMAKGQQ